MKRATCPRCGLVVIGVHGTPDDCLAHLKPRYKLASDALKAMHRRYRALEARMERARIQERAARAGAAKSRTVEARLERLEKWMESMEERHEDTN